MSIPERTHETELASRFSVPIKSIPSAALTFFLTFESVPQLPFTILTLNAYDLMWHRTKHSPRVGPVAQFQPFSHPSPMSGEPDAITATFSFSSETASLFISATPSKPSRESFVASEVHTPLPRCCFDGGIFPSRNSRFCAASGFSGVFRVVI